jgi:GntR family transcriptional regulator
MQLRRNSVVPLYRQMEAALLQRIESGELRPGERLPPESELARRWQVNRLTVRQAIGELARAGRVTVRRGAGTYVVEPPLLVAVDLPQLPTTEAEAASSELLAAQGQQLHEVVIHVGGDGHPAAVEALGVSDLTRIDTVTESPVGTWQISSYWVPRDRFPTLTVAAVGTASVYRTLREQYGVRLRYSWRTLVATAAPSADAEVLDVPTGAPIMLREGLNVDDSGRPTLFLSRRMRGDRIKYVLRYDTT